jgi:hypothetical protein
MNGSFLVTASGREIDLIYPRQGDILMSDIAHSLAQINRFTGHARRPYSVAEHSLLVCEIAQRVYRLDAHGLFAALMHDAHEAYCGDVASPAKGLLHTPWEYLEGRLQNTVRNAFALQGPAYEYRAAIKSADTIALATERAQLMPPSPSIWPILLHVEPVNWVDLMDPGRVAMSWSDWAKAFSDSADELDFGRTEKLFPVIQP